VDTRFLESFVVVADSGSVAEGARRLDLTPRGLAQRIRALEAELGARLVVRSGRTTQPTEAGRAILERARQLLRDEHDLRTIASADTPTGQLRIGVIGTALTGLLPTILTYLARNCPQLTLYILPGISADLYARVLKGDLDAAILVQPPFGLHKTCSWTLLREEPLTVIAPPTLPITDPKLVLATEPFIRYDRQHWGGRLAENYLRQAKIKPRERFELDALDAIAVLVARGLGVSLVPDWAPPWPAGVALSKRTIDAPDFVRRISLLWMRNSASLRLVRVFRAQVRAAMSAGALESGRLHAAQEKGPRSVRLARVPHLASPPDSDQAEDRYPQPDEHHRAQDLKAALQQQIDHERGRTDQKKASDQSRLPRSGPS
jgi:DNA-binding transcriptional LysR family regulator